MQIQDTYQHLLTEIKDTYLSGQAAALKAARRQMVLTYWAIGQHIVEFEQRGSEKAVYGSKLLERLSRDLSDQLGRGFSRTNLISMRLCYLRYPSPSLLSDQLTWGHFVEVLYIEHDLERSFYEKQAILEKWTVGSVLFRYFLNPIFVIRKKCYFCTKSQIMDSVTNKIYFTPIGFVHEKTIGNCAIIEF